jgi:hypothetical protein
MVSSADVVHNYLLETSFSAPSFQYCLYSSNVVAQYGFSLANAGLNILDASSSSSTSTNNGMYFVYKRIISSFFLIHS